MPEDFKALHAAVPRTQMAGLRNRIMHDYAGIDLELIWDIVQRSLPALRVQLNGAAIIAGRPAFPRHAFL